MKGLIKFQIFLIIFLIFGTYFTRSQNEEGESTITIMDQDEKDGRINAENSSENTDSNNEDASYDSTVFDDEDYAIINDYTNPMTSTSAVKPKVVELLPEAKVILPIRRKDTSHTAINRAPCGGVEKMKADTLTNIGSIINVIWETINPAPQANCTVKISPGLETESNFTVLYPLDYNSEVSGSFPCGRSKGFESQQFKLPDDYVCDQCTIQWAWHTEDGILYSCSDIIINGSKIDNCVAKCQNGGACFNGKCLCKDGYYGEYCEYSSIRFNN